VYEETRTIQAIQRRFGGDGGDGGALRDFTSGDSGQTGVPTGAWTGR